MPRINKFQFVVVFILLITAGYAGLSQDNGLAQDSTRKNFIALMAEELIWGNANIHYEREISKRLSAGVILGIPYYRLYNEDYGSDDFLVLSPTGLNAGGDIQFKISNSLSFGFGYNYRIFNSPRFTRDYRWYGESESYQPSRIFRFETSICNECTAQLNEKRIVHEPYLFFNNRIDIGTRFQTQVRIGIGIRQTNYIYDFQSIEDFGQTFEFEDYKINFSLSYPLLIFQINPGIIW